MSQDLATRLETLAREPVLLVASDYDGTLAGLVDDPAAARPDPAAVAALTAIAALPHTHTAVISGRALEDLRRFVGTPPRLRLFGSHGNEPDRGPHPRADRSTLDALNAELERLAAMAPGLRVERKPLGGALHYRQADHDAAKPAIDAALALTARFPGVQLKTGIKVVELVLGPSTKADALAALRHQAGATAALFLGDDATDEDIFRVLGPTDLGIKVGPEPSLAPFRVGTVADVAAILGSLLVQRRSWLAQRRVAPIQDHALLSDQRTLAVVDPGGRLVWHCVPRLDSTALFGALVGESAGSFDAAPAEDPAGTPTPRPAQRYDGDTFVLETSWPTLRVTDYLDCSTGRPFQRAGRTDLIRVLEGTGTARLRFAPRIDFGRIATRLIVHPGGLEVDGTPDPIVLYAPGVRWSIRHEGQHHTADAEVDLSAGPVVLELRSGAATLRGSPMPEPERRRQTALFWSGWAQALRLPPVHAAAVKRSAMVLKALCQGPTGAIAAAATTSLPEHLGGVRNWDYRFCWPRDAALAAAALIRLGNTGHAVRLLDWLLAIVDRTQSAERLRPIYTVSGSELPAEAEISSLEGYAGSRPVRVSNAAANQVQLDVFGPIVHLVAMLAERGAPLTPDHWRLVRAMTDAVAARWHEPDHGIWEMRTERRHHVHSKVMCWHAVDRALLVQDAMQGRQSPEWIRLRDQIREDVLAHGWDGAMGCFSGAYGSRSLDAATLAIPLTGLLPPDDPRVRGTVQRIEERLLSGPGVRRYLEDDGLPGKEGGMLICTGWLIEALHLMGRTEDAHRLLDALLSTLGPTGIAAEQFCTDTGLALGNFAQAYTHLAIINAAVTLAGPTPAPPTGQPASQPASQPAGQPAAQAGASG